LSSFWFAIKQKMTTKEMPIFSNSSHFEWRQKFELKWSLGGPLSKLCVTPPFSISTLVVNLKTRWAITGSWEPLVIYMFICSIYIDCHEIWIKEISMKHQSQQNKIYSRKSNKWNQSSSMIFNVWTRVNNTVHGNV
jgi:hypothetical protein